MPALATRTKTAIARPLKVLVPLIREELVAGEQAGLEHYRQAGDLLLEAKEQLAYGNWTKWLAQNFKDARGVTLSPRTADRYMKLAVIARRKPDIGAGADYTRIVGDRSERTQVHASFRSVLDAARDLDADLFAQERQTEEEEVRIRRELVSELIDLGYRALATRLHPDRGGSKDAMVRLNDLRTQLTQFAKTRRWL
jgi:hypothetical protein